MIYRCTNLRCSQFQRYGGRGIGVCDRWRTSFADFLDDLGPRPSIRHSLDRIDVDGDYAPGNVRWATPREQQWNRRDNARLTANGQTRTILDWAEQIGLAATTIKRRLREGISPELALLPTLPRQR